MRGFWRLLTEYLTSLLIFGSFYGKSSTTNQPLTANSLVSGIQIQEKKRQKWQIGLNFHFHSSDSPVCDGPDEDQTRTKHQFWTTEVFKLFVSSLYLVEFEVYMCSHWSVEVFDPNSVTLIQSNSWIPHVAFQDLAINRKHSDVNSGVALKDSKGKHQ